VEPVRRCPEHGVVAGGDCPDCGRDGELVLRAERRERLSRFLSGALRHFPADVGLSLDDAGWADRRSLVAAASRKYGWADEAAVEGVVATDPKGRFERHGDRVRAVYGHSVDVTIESAEDAGDAGGAENAGAGGRSRGTPDRLYHGTAPGNADPIEREGLRPMGRQEVHLSETAAGARQVGRRHAAEPIVFVVDAAAMRADGRRLSRRGEATWTADRVPPSYLERLDDG
jgi:putative RNA 2'-phosphotransferase